MLRSFAVFSVVFGIIGGLIAGNVEGGTGADAFMVIGAAVGSATGLWVSAVWLEWAAALFDELRRKS